MALKAFQNHLPLRRGFACGLESLLKHVFPNEMFNLLFGKELKLVSTEILHLLASSRTAACIKHSSVKQYQSEMPAMTVLAAEAMENQSSPL